MRDDGMALNRARIAGVSLLLLLLLLPAVAHAAACGVSYPDSGTCSGGTRIVNCASQLYEGCCEAVPGCDWEEPYPGDFVCSSSGGPRTVNCASFTDNAAACQTFGCEWTPAGTGGACGTNNGPNGYGESCSSNSDCAKCLTCDTTAHKCTQMPGVCTNAPAEYVMPPPPETTPPGSFTPQSEILALEGGTGVIASGSNIYKAGWFSDWKAMGLIGVAIVCSIIALAAMVGKAFNLPEAKAFANNELKQAVISVLIIVSLIGLVSFFHEIAYLSIQEADLPVNCNVPEPCYVAAAKYYLQTIYDTGTQYSKDNLLESIKKMRRATYGYNINMNKIYLLFAGFSIRFNAGESLVAERHGAMFSQVSKILASIYAQRFFIDVIAFGLAPLFILLGVVLRTFFFTRKLGGLLLAIAISLFIIYPLTYAFAWYTLNVTVYGERTLAVADPACPSECTTPYPTAFFSNPSDGTLVQFPTIQSMIRAGITKDNWNTGGPDLDHNGAPDFPGLVACRDLSAMGISSTVAPNSCSECPDYCRDVPFPTNMPGCTYEACAACNPGCKIVRQRLNCETDPACAGKCPDVCRTQIPLENKCFNDEKGGVIAADQSVSCSGCDDYPAWCMFIREEPPGSGTYTRVYDDPELNAACNGIDSDPTCPIECSYVTQIGTDATCDSICSYKNPATGVRTICPAYCRVGELLNDALWTSTYDIDLPPAFAERCASTPEIASACATCAGHPECLIEVPDTPLDGCAAYPTTNEQPESCLSCPDYCRRDSFVGFFEPYSKVARSATTQLPDVCDPTINPDISCGSSSSPPACGADCKMDGDLLICRPYDANHGTDVALCKACPETARYKVKYIKKGPAGCLTCDPGCYSSQSPGGQYAAIFSGATGGAQMALAPALPETDGTSPQRQPVPSGTISFAAPPGGTGQSPIMTAVEIYPDPIYEGGTLYGECTATVPDQGDLMFNFTWYKDGAAFYNGITLESAVSGVPYQVDYSITPSSYGVGDEWLLSCQAMHGNQLSLWMNSSSVEILPTPQEDPCTSTQTPINMSAGYSCSDADCPEADCQSDPLYIWLPNENDNPACKDVLQTGCPYGCRIKGAGANSFASFLDPSCATLCASLPDACKIGGSIVPFPTVPLCSEYLGNPGACFKGVCIEIKNKDDCNAASVSGCSWDENQAYCKDATCAGKPQAQCTGSCIWISDTSTIVKISNRLPYYGDRTACRQCPEQCRLDGYEGDCGVENNGDNLYVDCNPLNCQSVCRIEEPLTQTDPPPDPPPPYLCLPYPEDAGDACKDCPVLCRRSSDLLSYVEECPPECMLSANPATGCTDACRLDDPPVKACEGCFDCDMDCTYYPAIRTDCSDLCSDEALAGPVDILPNDFLRSLPGAKTSEDGAWAKSIGVLYIPAVVLPLFCIVIVIAFIRILSPILGGDIEIPGLGRII